MRVRVLDFGDMVDGGARDNDMLVQVTWGCDRGLVVNKKWSVSI